MAIYCVVETVIPPLSLEEGLQLKESLRQKGRRVTVKSYYPGTRNENITPEGMKNAQYYLTVNQESVAVGRRGNAPVPPDEGEASEPPDERTIPPFKILRPGEKTLLVDTLPDSLPVEEQFTYPMIYGAVSCRNDKDHQPSRHTPPRGKIRTPLPV